MNEDSSARSGATTGHRLSLAQFDRIDWTCKRIDLYIHDLRVLHAHPRTGREYALQVTYFRGQLAKAYADYRRYVAAWPDWEDRCTQHGGREPFRHTCSQSISERDINGNWQTRTCGARHQCEEVAQ